MHTARALQARLDPVLMRRPYPRITVATKGYMTLAFGDTMDALRFSHAAQVLYM